MPLQNKSAIFVAGLILALVCVLQAGRASRDGQEKNHAAPRLADTLPQELRDVVIRDLEIASTAEMQRAVSELLNYDDAVCRSYESKGVRLTVYVAAWRPGKMSPRLIAGHTPDICWPAAGWTRIRSEEPTQGREREIFAPAGLAHGAYRVFAQSGVREFLVYWHKVGDRFHDYGRSGGAPWWSILSEVWQFGAGPAREQRFYRISSNYPIELVWSRPEFTPVFTALHSLGLMDRS